MFWVEHLTKNLLCIAIRHCLLLRALVVDKQKFVRSVKFLKILWRKGASYIEAYYDNPCVCTINISRVTSLDFPNRRFWLQARSSVAEIRRNSSLLCFSQKVFCKYQINDNCGKRNMESVLNVEFSNPYRNWNQRRLDHPLSGFLYSCFVSSFPCLSNTWSLYENCCHLQRHESWYLKCFHHILDITGYSRRRVESWHPQFFTF